MRRRDDWPEKMNAALHERRTTPFSFGAFDCGLFVADVVEAMTDTDIAAELRGYSDAEGALRALRNFCGGGMREAMERIAVRHSLQPVRVPEGGDLWKLIQRGDICLMDAEAFETDPRYGGLMGISVGKLVAFASERGLLMTSVKAVRYAWRIL